MMKSGMGNMAKGNTHQEEPSASHATQRIAGPAKRGAKMTNPTMSGGINRATTGRK